MQFHIEADTDRGLKRRNNEDFYGILQPGGLVVVCDGMGGHRDGEIASQLAVSTIMEAYQRLEQSEIASLIADVEETLPAQAERLLAAVRLANYRIRLNAGGWDQRLEMGTTVVAAVLAEDRLIAAHVGDSRLYCLHENHLAQLTSDHSLRRETNGREGAPPNVVTRALGTEPEISVDILQVPVATHDRFLLCTDGLTNLVDSDSLQDILSSTVDDREAIRRLIAHANAAGGKDNITVAIAAIDNVNGNALGVPARYLTIVENCAETQRAKTRVLADRFQLPPVLVPGAERGEGKYVRIMEHLRTLSGFMRKRLVSARRWLLSQRDEVANSRMFRELVIKLTKLINRVNFRPAIFERKWENRQHD